MLAPRFDEFQRVLIGVAAARTSEEPALRGKPESGGNDFPDDHVAVDPVQLLNLLAGEAGRTLSLPSDTPAMDPSLREPASLLSFA